MRIAVYSHYFLPEIGAPSARIGDFARQWLTEGHEVHVATCFPNHPTGKVYPGYSLGRYQQETLQGINVHRNWTYVTPNKGILKKTLGHATFWVASAYYATRRMPAPACAIGTSPTFFAAMAARTCARRHHVPYIMEVRDLWPAIFVDLGVIRNRVVIRALEVWEMNLYRTAARIVTVTESFRQNLIQRGLPSDKVVTITNGADTNYWQPAPDGAEKVRRELGLQQHFVVLYIGAHGISQGLGAVIKVAERLREQRNVRFIFVGEGADKEKLVAECGRLGLSNVTFLDPVDKSRVRDFYSMADLCLVPLRNIPLFDTFIPSKMFEIMAVGRPILASVRGEAADILRRSGGAVVVEPEDDNRLAQSVLDLIQNPAAREEMGRRGCAFVQAHFSRRELARRYLEVIGEARREMGLEPSR